MRELVRIEELLGAKGYAWTRLDVAGDEATLDFVMREAACERDDLPVVFVADRVIGNLEALVRADVSGELAHAIAGDEEVSRRATQSPRARSSTISRRLPVLAHLWAAGRPGGSSAGRCPRAVRTGCAHRGDHRVVPERGQNETEDAKD